MWLVHLTCDPTPGQCGEAAMTTRDTGAADEAFDPLVAHPARVYNVWLGGYFR
jgi:hypothetical protein